MELHLDEASQEVSRSIISKVIVHDDHGKALFALEYDTVSQDVVFRKVDNDLTDKLIQTKSALTTEKGVEAFGSFISGADREVPVYRHLLTVYLPIENSKFTKYHVTLDSTLENFNFQSSLIYSAEFYSICYDALQDYLSDETISMESYPLISSFFHRKYRNDAYSQLLDDKNLDGTIMDSGKVYESKLEVEQILEDHGENIKALDLYITTISGAIIAAKQFTEDSTDYTTIHHMLFSSINSPGIYFENGQATLWFPFTKSKVGKINRAVSTTLNTLNYATAEKKMQEQVQTNIAHKFHDMVEILAEEQQDRIPKFGLQTNIGHLVCSIRFSDLVSNDMETILGISHTISKKVKQYGQAILSTTAKSQGFKPILE